MPSDNSGEARSPWAASVVLANGDSALIRELRPEDRDALAAFHRRQSADSVYRRFFSPKPELSSRDLDHFTHVDMIDRAAIMVESRGEFVAWSSYERWPGRNEAEVAFMVDDGHQGEGIATLMLEHLATIARSNGITGFTAEVLGDNRPMLAVFSKAGWPLQRRFDSGVVDLDWDLTATEEFLDSVERREKRADSRAVARILLPRGIAVIGASDRAGSIGASLWQHIVHSSEVPVYPVNPSRQDVDGRTCFASVADITGDVSLAVIAVPAAALSATIDECIAKRLRGAIIITNIDTTIDGAAPVDIEDLVARSRRNGLRLIGPSSMGIASLHPESLLQAALVDVTLPAGHVAISMQSGSLGAALLRQARELKLGMSWFVSLGDKCDVSANDLLQFWEDDEATRVIAMYTETFGNPRKFARIARRVSFSKPIVAVRTGAAASGSMGSALYQQAGLIEVPTVHALLDTCRVLADQPVLRGSRIAVLTNSASPGTLARAALLAAGLEPVEPPVQIDWRASAGEFEVAIRAALGDPTIDGVLVIHAPAVADDVNSPAPQIDAAAQRSTKPVVAVVLGGGDGPILPGSRVPGFSFPEQAAAALGRSHSYGQWIAAELDAASAPTRTVDPTAAAALIADLAASTPDDSELSPDLATIRQLLWSYGIDFPPAREATPATAVEVAASVGYPVAVKAVKRRPGRSARAGVALDLVGARDVTDAVATMVESLGDDAQQLVIQRMIRPGVDLRVRCELDDRLGVIVSVGLGGAQADVIDDRTSRLAPVSRATARTMLRETRAGGALADAGFDESPVVDVIVELAHLVSDHNAVTDIDLNPVIVSEDGAIVTDATVRLDRVGHHQPPLRTLG